MTEDELIKHVNATKHEDFDVCDVKNVGRPYYFNLDLFFKSVEQMINADEIQTALYMLDHMPGWYRDNQPLRVKKIRDTIYNNLMSVPDYACDIDENYENSSKAFGFPVEQHIALKHFQPRGELIFNYVNKLNDRNIVPHITEFGPANYWLPYGLSSAKLNFDYNAYSVQGEVVKEAKEKLQKWWWQPNLKSYKTRQYKIFCCFEVIEHLWNPNDIYHVYCRSGIDAKAIFISTPKYTLYGGMENWSTRSLGHIRTWTPHELLAFCTKHWPEHVWRFVDGNMMVLVGEKQ